MFRPRPAPEPQSASGDPLHAGLRATRRRGAIRRAAWVLALELAAGCGGGPHYDGRHYRGEDIGFRIGPPPDRWRRLESDEALLAFRDDQDQATIAVNGRCHRDGDDVPLQALTHHLFLNFTEREVIEQRELRLDGRAALETDLVARLDGVPKRFLVIVLKKDGCVYDFLHIADTDAGDAGHQEFRAFVNGFQVGAP